MPPHNPWLADSVYPISHFNPGATDSVLIAGPTTGKQLTRDDAIFVPNVMVSNPAIKKIGGDTVAFASGTLGILKLLLTGKALEALSFTPYPGFEKDAQKATPDAIDSLVQAWDAARRAKDDARLLEAISHMNGLGVNFQTAINGVYNLFDRDGFHYCVYGGSKVLKCSDDNVAREPARVVATADVAAAMPPQAAKAVTRITGLAMTYDGYLAAAAPGALVILDRDLEVKSFAAFLDEAIDNSIAVDEKGGIYVVTSRRMLKLVWNGESLSMDEKRGAWESGYEWAPDEKSLALGSISRGSGTTPSLMGFGDDPDKLVVIADGAETGTNLVAFWRDEIPEDFEQRPGTKSRRIAGQVRIDISQLTIEPSPNILGYGVAVMNSTYPQPFTTPGFPNAFTAGITRPAPRGIEKFIWDPQTRQFHAAWSNPAVDNSDIMVPVVSAATGMLYAAHKQDGVYQYVGLEWLTGEIRARWIFPNDSCIWNAFGGITTILEDGDLLIGGAFAIKRLIA
jgi:hypothetical protein